jgi:uncharacterized membrane protein (UPF0182 family)
VDLVNKFLLGKKFFISMFLLCVILLSTITMIIPKINMNTLVIKNAQLSLSLLSLLSHVLPSIMLERNVMENLPELIYVPLDVIASLGNGLIGQSAWSVMCQLNPPDIGKLYKSPNLEE